jgi:hypothetical protein
MSQILVNIVIPRQGVVPMKVRRDDTVEVVSRGAGKDEATFVFKGQVMNHQFTFGEYDVQDQDSIIMISESSLRTKERWVWLTAVDSEFTEMIKSTANMTSRIEFLRLRDLHSLRLETNPRRYRKLLSNFRSDGPDHRCDRNCEPTVIPASAVAPVCHPLPPMWRSSDGHSPDPKCAAD